ncbi:MAG: zeta toxin family protein [Ferruginibacter sp.]
MKDKISKQQKDFYEQNKQTLINKYLLDFVCHVDPDAIRDLFTPIGYNRTNVQKFQGICKLLAKDIFLEALTKNKGKANKVIFAAGLPATGKTSHLKMMAQNELIYDGTINDEEKFVEFVQAALDMGFSVEVFIYSADPKRAFKSNLERGDQSGRYVPISHYEKVAKTINNRITFLKKHFNNKVKFRNFEYTNFEGKQTKFSPLTINRNELERIANRHKFSNSKKLQEVIG